MPIKFELIRSESNRLETLLNVARIQEETLNCITESYRHFIIETVFKRLGIKPEDFAKTVVNLNTGELIINDDPEKKEEVKK